MKRSCSATPRSTRLEQALESEIAHRQQLELQTSRTEVALADTERNFRLLVESLTDYALIMLDPDGRVTSWNPGAERIKGYKADEIIGEHFGTFQIESDRNTGLPEKLLTTAAREGKFEGEGWRVRKDGSQFWASIVIYSIRDDHGELIGFAKVTRDISERREAQAAIERARQQMATTQKMEAIGQLTGGVAHDFNNLLMIVSGHVEILHRRLADPKLTQAIEAIQTASRHGERLTRQLLSFSRQQSLDPDVIDLRSRIETIRPMMASSLRENIRFVDAIAPDIWRIEVDTAEFELALVERRRQCARCDAQWRHLLDDRDQHRARAGHADRPAARPVRRDRAEGHRQRHSGGPDRKGVRSVFHHQGGRQGHRSRPVAGLRLRASIGRHRHGREQVRHGHHRDDLPAAHRQGAAGIRTQAARGGESRRSRRAGPAASWWSRTTAMSRR